MYSIAETLFPVIFTVITIFNTNLGAATSLDTDTTAKMSDGLTFDKTTTNQITITDQLTASLQIGSAGRAVWGY